MTMSVIVHETRISTVATSHTAVDEDLRCEIDTCVFDGVEDFGGSEKKKKVRTGPSSISHDRDAIRKCRRRTCVLDSSVGIFET